jgi:hypothetical protein
MKTTDAEQGEQREEQAGLVAGDEAGQAAPAEGRLGGPDQHLGGHVGVEVVVVRVVVVAGVLVHPPAVAHADAEVAGEAPGDLAGALGAEHLPVGQVVGDQRQLGERHGQQDGHGDVPPGGPDQEEGRPAAGHQQAHGGQAYGVIGRLPP